MLDIPVDKIIGFLKDPITFKYGKFVISPEGILNLLSLSFCV